MDHSFIITRRRPRSVWAAVAPVSATLALGLLLGTGFTPPVQAKDASAVVERGRVLVTSMGCNDCHTPWKLGPNGPEPDMTRMLSGHPESLVMPAPPAMPMPWGIAAAASFTAWSGPWGVSYTANLTPDPETGLGSWSEEDFLSALRSGRHMGRGRPILPPMPVQNFAALTDDDVRAIYGYLKSIPPIRNRVPDPLPPATTGEK